jgi:hypothetical protein
MGNHDRRNSMKMKRRRSQVKTKARAARVRAAGVTAKKTTAKKATAKKSAPPKV